MSAMQNTVQNAAKGLFYPEGGRVSPRLAKLAIFFALMINVACSILACFFKALPLGREFAVYASSSAVDFALALLFLAGFSPFEFYRLKVWASAGFFAYWFYCADRPEMSAASILAWIMAALLGLRMPKPALAIVSVLGIASMLVWNALIYNYGF